jgi:hypothetical protein
MQLSDTGKKTSGEPGRTRDSQTHRYRVPVKRHRGVPGLEYRYRYRYVSGKRTPGNSRDSHGTHGDTGAHTGNRITQTNLTTIQTHQPPALKRVDRIRGRLNASPGSRPATAPLQPIRYR